MVGKTFEYVDVDIFLEEGLKWNKNQCATSSKDGVCNDGFRHQEASAAPDTKLQKATVFLSLCVATSVLRIVNYKKDN